MTETRTSAGYTQLPLDSDEANVRMASVGTISGAATFIPVPGSPVESFEIEDVDARKERYSSKARGIWQNAVTSFKNNTGILLVASSQFFFALMNVAVKKLNSLDEPVSTLQLVFVRMAITYICCMIYMYFMKVPDPFLGPKGVRLWLLFRGFSGFFGLFGVYYSLEYLSLSDATVLTFLAPLFTGVVGALFLKEKFTTKEAIAGLGSFVGVILIARPQFLFGTRSGHVPVPSDIPECVENCSIGIGEKGTPEQRLIAVGVALVGVLGATGAYTSMAAIGKRAHPLHSLTSFASQCVIVSTILILVTHEHIVVPTRPEWLAMLAMIGIFGFIAQSLLVMGLQRETAGRGSMGVYIQVIFALALERIFFHVSPPFLSVTGMVIILACATYIILTKETSNKKTTQVSLEYPGESALEEGLLQAHNHETRLTIANPDLSESKENLGLVEDTKAQRALA